MKYTCPACKKGFDKAIKSHCPNCNAPLISRRGMVEGKLTFWWELDSAKMITTIREEGGFGSNQLPEEQPVDITVIAEVPEKVNLAKYPVRLTEPGQLPVVIQSGENEYDVWFQHMMYSGMVYCPKCQSPAFQNMQLFGDLEHWCAERFDGKACRARTTYHFNDPIGVEVN